MQQVETNVYVVMYINNMHMHVIDQFKLHNAQTKLEPCMMHVYKGPKVSKVEHIVLRNYDIW